MKERPVLFSGPMVRATLEGRKTHTRRVMKPQPLFEESGDEWCPAIRPCPHGKPGDHLWVRETWRPYRAWIGSSCGWEIEYKAGGKVSFEGIPKAVPTEKGKWTPSIHMPRWASRLTLEITGVRVERLQDISREDAISEGINCPATLDEPCKRCGACLDSDATLPIIAQCNPRSAFANLWQSLNGKRPGFAWDDNPYVWVVEFQRV